MTVRKILAIFAVVVGTVACDRSTQAQDGGPAEIDWKHFGRDLAATRYSPADQIDRHNVGALEIAWRWTTPDAAIATAKRLRVGQFKATPLMIDGVLFTSTPLSQVAAIDAASGKTLWVHDPKAYELGRPANSGFQHRGVASWSDGSDTRIIIATGNRQLVAVNAQTGQTYPDFGRGGWVDLSKGLGRRFNKRQLGFNSPPIIVGDVIVLGSVVSDGPRTLQMPPGDIRGFDVRTGQQLWRFHTIPRRGEFGVETWHDNSWRNSGNTNAWGPLSADPDLGFVYLPIGTPTGDYYGGHRPGNNLFAESVLCLDANTGKRVWHFQAVHHGLWDFDFCAAPNLVDIVVDGKPIKAVAEVSKQGFCYVFDRTNGKPVWPIEERPVPQTNIPGEWTSPTQPFPTKPPAFERQGVSEADLIDLTPDLLEQAKSIMNQYVRSPLFTPPALLGEDGKLGALSLPGGGGGANWAGAAVDPESGVLYVQSNTITRVLAMQKADPTRTEFDYVRVQPRYVGGPQGLPLVKPPWGRITAIDLNRGEILWQVPHGDGPRDHPAIAHLDLGPLGAPGHRGLSSGGPVLTKTLLFYSQAAREADLTMSDKDFFLRAFDKQTGRELWEYRLDRAPHGAPMTYVVDGRQFVVVATGGSGAPAELIAFALPE